MLEGSVIPDLVGAGHQAQERALALDLRAPGQGRDVLAAQTTVVHCPGDDVVLGKCCWKSSVAARAVGMLSGQVHI